MSFNRKLLKQMIEESKQKKPQSKPKDRIVDPMGQWAHPGEVTRIPSNRITMQGVPYPVLAKGSSGAEGVMYPDQEYFFPDSTYVDEYPLVKAQNGLNFLRKEDPEMSFEHLYNTSLTKEETNKFNKWVKEESSKQGRNILMDKGAYDVQGFWKSGDWKRRDSDGHGTDTWKKPNHPTFSNQSKYHGINGFYGGNWTKDGGYQPSKQTMSLYDENYYKWLFGSEPNRPEHLDLSRYKSGVNKSSILYYKNGGDISIPNLEEGNWLDRYDDGGLTTAETTRPPIYVDNPNDPGLKAYNDSLYYYNQNPKIAKEMFILNRALKKYIESNNLKQHNSGVLTGTTKESSEKEWNKARAKYKKFKESIGLIGIESGATNSKIILPRVPNPLYKRGTDDNLTPENMMEFTFKKPVQPYIFQEQPQLKIVGNERRDIAPSFNTRIPSPNIPSIARPDNKYMVSYTDEEGVGREEYFPTPELADQYMNWRRDNDMFYGTGMSRRGVFQGGGSLPRFQNRGEVPYWMKRPSDISQTVKSNAQIQREIEGARRLVQQKEQEARTRTTIGQDTRTAEQKQQDAEFTQQVNKRRKDLGFIEGLGHSQETIDRNRKQADRIIHNLVDVPATIVGASELAYGLGKGVAKVAPRVGEYLTTQTPLKNAYKYNPWAFKPNPEAYYHRSPNLENVIIDNKLVGFGATPKGKILNDEAIKKYGRDVINLKKAANYEPYFSKGTPLDWGRYNKPNTNLAGKAGQMAQGYPGPYLAEATNVPFVAKADGKLAKVWNSDGSFKRGIAPNETGSYATPVEGNVPLENLKFYKEDWLRGYKEFPKPTSVSSSVDDLVDLYRVQDKGFDINSNTVANMEKAVSEGRATPWQKMMLNNEYDRKRLMARDKFWGQWFEKDPKRLEYYINDKGPDSEILHLKVPRSEAPNYSIKNFESQEPNVSGFPLEYHQRMSLSPETEYILPKDIIQGAKKYPLSEWQRLIKEHKPWMGILPLAGGAGALQQKKQGGQINWLDKYN